MAWTNWVIEHNVGTLGATTFIDKVLTLILIPLFFLLSALVRKNIFNDQLNWDFSLWGGTVLGVISYIATLGVCHLVWHIHALNWALLFGLIFMLIGGLVGPKLGLPDGQADSGDGSYE